MQTAEQITAIVEEARKSPHGVADWDNDEYLDGALNQEDYGGGSYDEWGKISLFDAEACVALILHMPCIISTRNKSRESCQVLP